MFLKGKIFIGFALILIACDPATTTPTESQPTTTAPKRVSTTIDTTPRSDPLLSWAFVTQSVNPLATGAIAYTEGGLFNIAAIPQLTLYSFDGSKWSEADSTIFARIDPIVREELNPDRVVYDTSIQSYDITGDGSVEYIVNFRPAGWQIDRAPNQGRNLGAVVSCDYGNCKTLPFWEPEAFGNGAEVHENVETIRLIENQLIASWYGSCGRPCGTLVYTWSTERSRLEAREANERESQKFSASVCSDFQPNYYLNLRLCDNGQAVQIVQESLREVGFSIRADGEFGPDTRLALQVHQRSNNLTATGEVDEGTWKLLTRKLDLPGRDRDANGAITPEELDAAADFTTTTSTQPSRTTAQSTPSLDFSKLDPIIFGGARGEYISSRRANSILCTEGQTWHSCVVYYDNGSSGYVTPVTKGSIVTTYRYWGFNRWTCYQLYESGGIREIFC